MTWSSGWTNRFEIFPWRWESVVHFWISSLLVDSWQKHDQNMHLVVLVVARHVEVSAGFVHEWNYLHAHCLTFTLTTKADYNLTHEEHIKEAEVNHVGPSQDWDEEDEAKISRHPQGGNDNEKDEGCIQKGSNVHSRHDQEQDVVGDCSNLQETFEATQRQWQGCCTHQCHTDHE